MRATGRPPVWKAAYSALTGLYLRDDRPAVKTSFDVALAGGATIGERIGHPVDRDRQLAGSVWFYYGSRYAAYLDDENDPAREDYEDSELELMPGNAQAYLRLADYSAERGRTTPALTDYAHSLDLNGDQPGVVNKIAQIQWKNGNRAEALAAWGNAVKLLAAEMDARHVPETFWGDFAQVLKSVSAAGQFDSVRPQVDAMLRVYLRRNGTYRTEPLLEAAYRANGNSVNWLLDITASAADQEGVLWSILPHTWSEQGQWIEKNQLSRIYAKILEIAEAKAQSDSQAYTGNLDSDRRDLVNALLDEKKFAEARQVLSAVPTARRQAADWLPAVLRLADGEGSLAPLIDGWKKNQGGGPALTDLRNASTDLSPPARRMVLRYVYETAIARRDFTSGNFLGLAAIHLDENDTAGAVALLKRLTLVSPDMYADEDAAAHLLEKRHKFAEAIEFLRALSTANPWDANYRMRLAKDMLAADRQQTTSIAELNAVAADPAVKYEDRVQAARALKGREVTADSGELKALAAGGCPPAQSVSQALYVAARVEASACSSQAQTRAHLLGDALAAAPDDAALRLRYIFAAFAAGEDARALAAASPYLQGGYDAAGAGSDANGPDDGANEAESGETQREGNPSTLAGMRPADAARLIELSEAAYEKQGNITEALHAISTGLDIVKQDDLRKPLEQLRDAVQTQVARAASNDARAPDVHAALEQDRVVQPKLLPGMPVPEEPAKEEQP